jgi:general secretion pathway protein C
MTKPWPARLAAFFLWALAAVSASYWFTKVNGASGPSASVPTPVGEVPVVQAGDLARVFGPAKAAGVAPATVGVAAPDPSARLRLLGVVANRTHRGVALISIDGQPPRPYRVGSALDGGWTLQQVGTRTATLGASAGGNGAFTLELAPLAGTAPAQPLGRPSLVTPAPTPGTPSIAAPLGQGQGIGGVPNNGNGDAELPSKD